MKCVGGHVEAMNTRIGGHVEAMNTRIPEDYDSLKTEKARYSAVVSWCRSCISNNNAFLFDPYLFHDELHKACSVFGYSYEVGNLLHDMSLRIELRSSACGATMLRQDGSSLRSIYPRAVHGFTVSKSPLGSRQKQGVQSKKQCEIPFGTVSWW